MSALEDKLIEEFRKLDEAHQQQALQIIKNMQPKPFDFDEWMRQVEQFRAELRAEYGEDHVFGVLDLLHEMRQ